MDKMQVLKDLVEMFRRGEIAEVSPEVLLADLPAEALSGPKTDAQGNVLRSWDADLTGYDAPYVLAEAVRRLGAGGWVDMMIYGEPRDGYISRRAMESGQPDGVEIDGECVMYFPTLHTARMSAGTACQKTLGDAKKAVQTMCRKRALASIGIGWRGYTDDKPGQDPAAAPMQGTGPRPEPAPKQSAAPAQSRTPAAGGGQPAKPQASPNKPISEAQSKMIRKMFEEKGVTPENWLAWSGGRKLADLNAAEASAIIDGLIKGTHELLGGGAPSDDPYGGVQ